MFTSTATGHTSATATATEVDNDSTGGDNEYIQRFTTLYNKLKDPANGYFSPQGVPYHSVETFMVEAPDHGHETTSEAFSYYLWLEAAYGKVTGDWTQVQRRLGLDGEVHHPGHRGPADQLLLQPGQARHLRR